MNYKYKYLFKNLGILTISNFASKILVFLLVPLYTSCLSTSEYGTYDLIISAIQLIFPIITVNIIDAVMRYAMDKEVRKNDIAVIGLRFIVQGIVGVGILLFFNYKFNIMPGIKGLEVYVFLYYLFYTLNQFLIQFAKGLEKVGVMGFAGVLGTAVMLISNVICLLVLKKGLIGFFVANIVSQALPAMYLAVVLEIKKYICNFKTNDKLKREMIKYSAPLIFATLGWWVNNAADKFFVTFFVGVSGNGLLSVSYKIPSILNTVQSIFIQAWQISAIKEYTSKDKGSFYGNAFIALNIIMCLVGAGLIMLSKPIAHILYAKDFFIAWEYVPFLIISSVVNSAAGFLGPILSAQKNSKAMAKSALYGIVFNLIFNYILILFWGIQGATIATAISSLIIYLVRRNAVSTQILIKREVKVYMGWIALCVMAIMEIYNIKWYIEIIVVLYIVFINYKELLSTLNKIKKFFKEKKI